MPIDSERKGRRSIGLDAEVFAPAVGCAASRGDDVGSGRVWRVWGVAAVARGPIGPVVNIQILALAPVSRQIAVRPVSRVPLEARSYLLSHAGLVAEVESLAAFRGDRFGRTQIRDSYRISAPSFGFRRVGHLARYRTPRVGESGPLSVLGVTVARAIRVLTHTQAAVFL